MNLINLTALSALCASLIGCASFPPDRAYIGTLNGAGQLSAETVFYQNENKEILGLYVYYEGQRQTPGILDSCKMKYDRILYCQWRDRNGSGNFAAVFSDDYAEFHGAWGGLYTDVLESGSSWSGKRLNPSAARRYQP